MEIEEKPMKTGTLEKRACGRFRIPGATVRMKIKRSLFRKESIGLEAFRLIDLSRGGIRFMTTSKLRLDKPVVLVLAVPGEEKSLELIGHVRWFASAPDRAYRYQFGIQLAPYGDKDGFNPAHVLERIIALERVHPPHREDLNSEA
jgi:Tfp pilus assembly protein PilZ